MKIILNSEINLIGLSPADARKVESDLAFDNPQYFEAVRQGRSTWKIPRKIVLAREIDGGLAVPVGFNCSWLTGAEILDSRRVCPVSIPANINLRNYQSEAVGKLVDSGGGVLVAPTGSGKTVTAIALAARLGQRTLILVRSTDLARQWIDAVKKFTGLDAGLVGGGKNTEGDQFTIGLVQTLAKRDLSDMDYGCVIVDECHALPSAQAFAIVNRLDARYKFGLSATPNRRDNLDFMIFLAVGPIAHEIKIESVGDAVLPVEVRAIHIDCRLPEVGSWSKFVDALANQSERNALILLETLKFAQKTGVAVLTSTVDHAERLAGLIGDDALLLHGRLPKAERERRMNIASGAKIIVGTLSLLSEGIDLPHLGCVILASPVSAAVDRETPSAIRLLQAIGRARRPYRGKSRAYVVDLVDAHPLGRSVFHKRRSVYAQKNFVVHDIYR